MERGAQDCDDRLKGEIGKAKSILSLVRPELQKIDEKLQQLLDQFTTHKRTHTLVKADMDERNSD